MPSGSPVACMIQLFMSPSAVERAGIPDVAVVIDHVDDVGRFAPADALQMNSKRGADWAAADIERKGIAMQHFQQVLYR